MIPFLTPEEWTGFVEFAALIILIIAGWLAAAVAFLTPRV
jgi:hypothetical protein